MYTSINRNARPNNKQLITYYKHVITYKEYIQYPVESTYNNNFFLLQMEFTDSGSQSMDSPPREMKMMEAVAVASGHLNGSMTSLLPLSPASPDRQHCSSTTQLSESSRLSTHVSPPQSF